MLWLYLLYLPIIYICFKIVNNSDLLLSTVSIVISIFALFQTKKQINLSNKHHLFEKRMQSFSFCYKCFCLVDKNIEYISEDKICQNPGAILSYLTNTAALEMITGSIAQMKDIDKDDKQYTTHKIVVLTRLEEIEQSAYEDELIWDNQYANKLYNFILAYKELLLALYKYTLIHEETKKTIDTIVKMLDDNQSEEDQQEVMNRQNAEIASTRRVFDGMNFGELISDVNNSFQIIKDEKIFEQMKKDIKVF